VVSLDPLGPTDFPELISLVGTAISIWAHIDALLGSILAAMLGGKSPEVAIAMYTALTSPQAQMAVLKVAADEVNQSDDNKRLFDAIISMCGSTAKIRHKLAHWVWSSSPDEKGCIVACLSKGQASRDVDVTKLFDNIRLGKITSYEGVSYLKIDVKRIFVYK
jgi:hypothetical protein